MGLAFCPGKLFANFTNNLPYAPNLILQVHSLLEVDYSVLKSEVFKEKDKKIEPCALLLSYKWTTKELVVSKICLDLLSMV